VLGVAGALYGHYYVTFSPSDFYFNTNGLDLVILPIAMLVVGGAASVTGAVTGCYFVMVVYTFFNRWEVDGFGGTVSTAPAGTSNLALAAVLLLALILRPRGLSGGKEISWPTEWSLDAFKRIGGRPRFARTPAEQPAAPGAPEQAVRPNE
jgi:branched-chain amino acid transport system permease protein